MSLRGVVPPGLRRNCLLDPGLRPGLSHVVPPALGWTISDAHLVG